MVAYVTYAEKFGWTPQQVDQLTIGQDEWLMPIKNALDKQRAYEQKKSQESAQRVNKAEGGSRRNPR